VETAARRRVAGLDNVPFYRGAVSLQNVGGVECSIIMRGVSASELEDRFQFKHGEVNNFAVKDHRFVDGTQFKGSLVVDVGEWASR
jgi:hypothetical protein